MIPSFENVMNRRATVRTILRAACLLLLVIGLLPILWETIDSLIDGSFRRTGARMLTNISDELSWFIANGAVAAAFWLVQARLLRWLVPWPNARCPQCDYRLERITSPRCPECGCELPPGLVRRVSGEPSPGS